MLGRLLSLLAIAGVCATHTAASALQWEWLTPFPHRQSWRSLASGNGNVVGVTEGYGNRSIYTWVQQTNWAAVVAPTNFLPRNVIFGDGQFVAVGGNATVMTSKDGLDWKLRHTDAAGGSFDKVASGGGTFVVLAGGPFVSYSKDLTTWKMVSLNTGYTLVALSYGNGVFVAIGQGGRLFTSLDGASWTEKLWPANVPAVDWSGYQAGLAFRNGIFVYSTPGGTAISADGRTWTPSGAQGFSAIAATENGFLGIAGGTVWQSPTGSSWSQVLEPEVPTGFSLYAATSANGMTVVAGDNGLLYSSEDLVSWRRWVKEVDYTDSQIAASPGMFLRYGGPAGICISSNGADWQRIEGAPGLQAASFGNDLWVGFDHEGKAAISKTGKSWESIALPALAKNRILYAEGSFVGEADNGLLTSVDGREWHYTSFNGQPRLVGRANGIWSATVSGQSATSANGVDWTVHPQQGAGASVYAAGNSRFVGIIGGGMGPGVAKISTDGINWQTHPITGLSHFEQSLTFGGGQFVLTDNYGGVFTSQDGVNWSGGRQASQVFTSAAYTAGRWLVCGGDAVLASTTRLQAASILKLQLVKQLSGTWSLSLQGNAGEKYQIETTSDLNQAWSALQTVAIPQTGQLLLPTEITSPNRFFRAIAIAE